MMSRGPDRFDLLRLLGHPISAVHRRGARYTIFDNLTREKSIVRGSATV